MTEWLLLEITEALVPIADLPRSAMRNIIKSIALPTQVVLCVAWIALMDEDSYRIVKLAAGEMTELLGYCVVAAGCDESRLLRSEDQQQDKTI